MKYFAVLFFVAATSAGRLENVYLPPSSSGSAGGSGSFLNTPVKSASGGAGPVSAYSGPTAAPVAILRLNNDNNGDGTYNFDFETENRISQQETGHVAGAGADAAVIAQGSYSFVAPDGQAYTVNYVADENGFQPQGAHIPTAPPVPEEILKALEQNAADEAAGIVDDGQYRPDPSEAAASRQYLAPKPSGSQQNGGYRY
ncbi:endocuticle structural glycoprotein SgAbd-2-like [Anoplophora glabripennis]|uniref:endocuticle structural glycoprotein SgAbd-2-like n=1 Tax=Anoplophora glabripennis TaxID=217634 RepID=UPI000874FAED|nr:endocuticle structural glycoprotein SgAbd-2-like [Anoplophora glabripennis]